MEIIKNIRFWEMVCYLAAALTLQFAPEYAVDAAALLIVVLSVLKLFKIVPEVQAAKAVEAKKVSAKKAK